MQHFLTLLRDERGAALAEALISLPIFVAVLGGTVALNSMYSAKLEAKSRARRVAWLQADSGECPEQTCSSGTCRAAEGTIRTEGLDGLLAVQDSRFKLRSFLGRVGTFLLGKSTRGVGHAEAALASTSSAGRTVQYGVVTLLCNTTTRYVESGGNILEHACATGLETAEFASEVCK